MKTNILSKSFDEILTIIESDLSNRQGYPCKFRETNEPKSQATLSKLKKKCQESHRIERKFLDKNAKWLEEILIDNEYIIGDNHQTEAIDSGNKGRPPSDFSESSTRTKRRKTEKIRCDHSPEELGYATQMKLRAEEKLDAAKVVEDILLASPSKASEYRRSLGQQREVPFSSEKALALLINNNLSKSQYSGIRTASLEHNSKIFPSDHEVLAAKPHCYPNQSEIKITESCAEVNLQALLNHTVQRIFVKEADIIESFATGKVDQYTLICKWGCDGTSGQGRFKQKFENDDGCKTDEYIFFTSLVPLQLMSTNPDTKENIIFWKNPRPSSPRFCRPLKIEFEHKTVELTKTVVDDIKKQEENLRNFETTINRRKIQVSFSLALTMIDGKVCNSLTDISSTQRCHLCHCISSQFNKINEMLNKKINQDHLQFGLPILHAWIRFLSVFYTFSIN